MIQLHKCFYDMYQNLSNMKLIHGIFTHCVNFHTVKKIDLLWMYDVYQKLIIWNKLLEFQLEKGEQNIVLHF